MREREERELRISEQVLHPPEPRLLFDVPATVELVEFYRASLELAAP
jgi:hypothetical protein